MTQPFTFQTPLIGCPAEVPQSMHYLLQSFAQFPLLAALPQQQNLFLQFPFSKLGDSAASTLATSLLAGDASQQELQLRVLPEDEHESSAALSTDELLEGTTPKKCRIQVQHCSPSSCGTTSGSQVSTPLPSPHSSRKNGQPVPDEYKNAAYFERRRKNNDAAKRSRDLRRQKEVSVANKAQQLEQENMQLRTQVALLKNEMAKLQVLLFPLKVPTTLSKDSNTLPLVKPTVTNPSVIESKIKEELSNTEE